VNGEVVTTCPGTGIDEIASGKIRVDNKTLHLNEFRYSDLIINNLSGQMLYQNTQLPDNFVSNSLNQQINIVTLKLENKVKTTG